MKTDSKNIFCSVSAGYSSVMMAVKLREWYPDHNIINVMANTSKERKESLEFMNECDKHFGLNLIWIEAIFNECHGIVFFFNFKDFSFHWHFENEEDRSRASKRISFETIRYLIKEGFDLPLY